MRNNREPLPSQHGAQRPVTSGVRPRRPEVGEGVGVGLRVLAERLRLIGCCLLQSAGTAAFLLSRAGLGRSHQGATGPLRHWDFLAPMAGVTAWVAEQPFAATLFPGTSLTSLCVHLHIGYNLDLPFFSCGARATDSSSASCGAVWAAVWADGLSRSTKPGGPSRSSSCCCIASVVAPKNAVPWRRRAGEVAGADKGVERGAGPGYALEFGERFVGIGGGGAAAGVRLAGAAPLDPQQGRRGGPGSEPGEQVVQQAEHGGDYGRVRGWAGREWRIG